MSRSFMAILVSLPLILFALSSEAFEVDGFRSGMTREQLTTEAVNRGLEVKEGPYGSILIGKFAEYRIVGSFGFCGDALIAYSHSIDFDVDYIPTLRTTIERLGQPQRVRTLQSPWSGSGGGNVQSVGMTWYTGNDRINLSFNPEGRDGKGQLRYFRSASIDYASKNACSKEF